MRKDKSRQSQANVIMWDAMTYVSTRNINEDMCQYEKSKGILSWTFIAPSARLNLLVRHKGHIDADGQTIVKDKIQRFISS